MRPFVPCRLCALLDEWFRSAAPRSARQHQHVAAGPHAPRPQRPPPATRRGGADGLHAPHPPTHPLPSAETRSLTTASSAVRTLLEWAPMTAGAGKSRDQKQSKRTHARQNQSDPPRRMRTGLLAHIFARTEKWRAVAWRDGHVAVWQCQRAGARRHTPHVARWCSSPPKAPRAARPADLLAPAAPSTERGGASGASPAGPPASVKWVAQNQIK